VELWPEQRRGDGTARLSQVLQYLESGALAMRATVTAVCVQNGANRTAREAEQRAATRRLVASLASDAQHESTLLRAQLSRHFVQTGRVRASLCIRYKAQALRASAAGATFESAAHTTPSPSVPSSWIRCPSRTPCP